MHTFRNSESFLLETRVFLTWATSSWVMGCVWKRALALRSRVSPWPPSGVLSVVCERRLKRAIFSVKLSMDMSGSSETFRLSPSTPALETWDAFGLCFSWSWTVESGSEGWILGTNTGKHTVFKKSTFVGLKALYMVTTFTHMHTVMTKMSSSAKITNPGCSFRGVTVRDDFFCQCL